MLLPLKALKIICANASLLWRQNVGEIDPLATFPDSLVIKYGYLHGGIVDWGEGGLKVGRLAFVQNDVLQIVTKLRSLGDSLEPPS
jgi:hypothetical protein